MPVSIDCIRGVFFAEHTIWRDQLRERLCSALRGHDARITLSMSELLDRLVDQATIEAFDASNRLGLRKD